MMGEMSGWVFGSPEKDLRQSTPLLPSPVQAMDYYNDLRRRQETRDEGTRRRSDSLIDDGVISPHECIERTQYRMRDGIQMFCRKGWNNSNEHVLPHKAPLRDPAKLGPLLLSGTVKVVGSRIDCDLMPHSGKPRTHLVGELLYPTVRGRYSLLSDEGNFQGFQSISLPRRRRSLFFMTQ